jgi:hypothetical protein
MHCYNYWLTPCTVAVAAVAAVAAAAAAAAERAASIHIGWVAMVNRK